MLRRLPILLMTAALAGPLLLPGAGAAAPDPASYETRILHDHEDEPASILDGQHGFDAIALDAREIHDTAFGENMLLLRLTLDQGCDPLVLLEPCPELRQTVQFNASSGSHELVFASMDGGATFYGNMDWYGAPQPLSGSMFAVEGAIRMSRLAIAPGSVLEDWFSKGYAGEDPADDMDIGIAAGVPDLLEQAFNIGQYSIRAPDYYHDASLAQPSVTVTPGAGLESRVSYAVENLVAENQSIRLDMGSMPGLEARFEHPESGAEVTFLELDFLANESKEIDIVLRSSSTTDRSGALLFTSKSSLGGFEQDALQVHVDAPGDSTPPPTTTTTQTVTVTGAPVSPGGDDPDPQDHEGGESKDSPGLEVVAAVAVLGAVVLLARRRME